MAAAIGILACVTMVLASASSGPAMSALIGAGAICMWRLRRFTRLFRWLLLAAYLVLMLVMTRPAYYIIQRLEVVGGSTGWYRAWLIETALNHLDEWWFAGTDYTRHWMFANAVNDQHIDITNHYLSLGVLGGIPLMLLHIAILTVGFSFVGQGLRDSSEGLFKRRFMFWSLGCGLLAHTVATMSISYYDQSFLFLYFTLAAITSAYASTRMASLTQPNPIAVNTVPVVAATRHPSDRVAPARQHSATSWVIRGSLRHGRRRHGRESLSSQR
jgi:hypothetical protein